jgi:hypothetical protein
MGVPAMTDAQHPPPSEDAGSAAPGDVARAAEASDAPLDPVLARRARIARWVLLGKRIGYGALAVAIAVFSVALYWDLPKALIGVIIACLAVASVALLPSIVFDYGVRAAEREDRRLGNPTSHRRGRP